MLAKGQVKEILTRQKKGGKQGGKKRAKTGKKKRG
jgi:hypothetical protein